jgi:hypothetical protein
MRCTIPALPVGPTRIVTGAPVIASSAIADETRATETPSPSNRCVIILTDPVVRTRPYGVQKDGPDTSLVSAWWGSFLTEIRLPDRGAGFSYFCGAPCRPIRTERRLDAKIVIRRHFAKRQGLVGHDKRRSVANEHDNVALLLEQCFRHRA